MVAWERHVLFNHRRLYGGFWSGGLHLRMLEDTVSLILDVGGVLVAAFFTTAGVCKRRSGRYSGFTNSMSTP